MYHHLVTEEARRQLESSLKLELREYTPGEVEDFAYRLRDVDWLQPDAIAQQPSEVQTYITNELLLCKVDWKYWSERYCNPPETPMWMADMSFKPLGEVKVGDRVVGWEKRETHGKKRKIKAKEALVSSEVLAINRRMAPIVKITLASGRIIRCTADHKWSSAHNSKSGHPWVEAKVGTLLRHVITPVGDCPDKVAAAWLGGMFDGEGTLSTTGCLTIAQSQTFNPEVCAKLSSILTTLGFSYVVGDDKYRLLGGREMLVKFYLWCRPCKWQERFLNSILGFCVGSRDRVIAVESAGMSEVIGLKTTTGNYIAHGYASKNCRIVDDGGRIVPVRLRPSQQSMLDKVAEAELRAWKEWKDRPQIPELNAKIRLILVKARQVGGTVLGEDLVAHLTLLFKNTRSIIASDDIRTNSVKLYRVFTMMYDNIPGWMKPLAESRVKATNMHFSELNSDLVVGGGNQKNTLGQGMTIDAVHLTEMSTWTPDVAEAVDEDLKPAFESSRKHHSLFMIESTGQGGKGNWFHDQYQSAVQGKSRFIPMFLGWHSCPDKWALYDPSVVVGDETLSLAKRLEGENGVKLTRDQLVWYQTTRADYESRGKLQQFLQEFPSSAEEAFQMGVRSVFSIETRTRIRNECRVPIGVYDINFEGRKLKKLDLTEWLNTTGDEKAANRLLMWENPRPGYTYVVGVDASYGVDGGDNSTISVLRVGNRWEKDEQVAEWAGNVPPAWLDTVAWVVGHIYSDKIEGIPALMAIETNPGSPGIVCQTKLLEKGYTNFYVMRRPNKIGGGWTKDIGWSTTEATRTPLLETGVDALNRGLLKVNSPFFVGEMGTFVVKMTATGRRKLEHADGYHDDRIFALFIAYYVAHEADVVSVAEERARYWDQRKNPEPRQIRQFQTILGTQEDLMQKWEEKADELIGME